MKKIRLFIALLLAMCVTVGIIIFPDMYYNFFDRNIVSSESVIGVHNFESMEGNLTPEQAYKLFTEGRAIVADTPLASSFVRADILTRESLERLSEWFTTNDYLVEAISCFLQIENIDNYQLTTYCGVVDSKPVSMTLMRVQGWVDNAQYGVTIDVATGIVYEFSQSVGITGVYESDGAIEKEVSLDLAAYWVIIDSDIRDYIFVEIIPDEYCHFFLI